MENKKIRPAFADFTALTIEASWKKLASSQTGLSTSEAAARLKQYGLNELHQQSINWLTILGRQFKSPFIYLLVVASIITAVLGEHLDTGMIIIFILINATLGFVQEYHSEQSVKLLKNYIRSQARVRRGGKDTLVDSGQLVPGDIVILEDGDIIPADIRWLEVRNISVDEEILTGESAPVNKDIVPLTHDSISLQQASMIGFSGTTIVSGRGLGVVVATGDRGYIGGISHLTQETVKESVFAKDISRFSSFILKLISSTLVLVIVANLILKQGKVGITELIIFALALAVSVIPEALPVVTTVSLSRSARRLAKNKVVVKRLSAIEDLGSIQVLCTDKTGTLTENKLTVKEIKAPDRAACLLAAAAASIDLQGTKRQSNNAFDLAIWNSLSAEEKKVLPHYKIIDVQPFDPKLRRNAVIAQHAQEMWLIVRGAPEVIWPLTNATHAEIEKYKHWVQEQGQEGKRIIAIARKRVNLAESTIKHAGEHHLELLGHITFSDPIKPTTKKAVQEARKLGVQVKILTGDSPEVAGAVAYEIGLISSPQAVITGEKIDSLSTAELHETVKKFFVFARVTPEQKFRIIQLLQETYEVGFLGEGINDAPALKIANVALAVESASDVAREAADIVLLQKSLSVIVDGIREGREVFANTIKYIKATLGSNLGNFYSLAIASLMIEFLPLLPLQILLVNLLSDVPMITIATDTVDANELKTPKQYQVKDIILLSTFLGLTSSLFDFLFFGLLLPYGQQILQTGWFIGSILTELLLIFSIRTSLPFWRAKRPSLPILILTTLAAALTIFIPFWPPTAKIFSFVTLSTPLITSILCISIIYIFATELVKHFYYRMVQKN